jgi:Leucine-rich repeat (LRR) protein
VEEWINNIEEPEYEEMVIATEEVGESSNSQQPISVAASCEVANAIPRTLHAFSTVAHLNGINLRDVPQIGHFNCLKTLNLSGNSISKCSIVFSVVYCQFSSMSCQDHKMFCMVFLARLPAGCLPQSLHVLDLSSNKIPQIEGLRELTRLRILNLSRNRISKIGHGEEK